MRHHWIIVLAIIAYNALLMVGLWHWEWPPGNIYVLLVAEGVLIASCTFAELLRSGMRASSEGLAVVVGFVQALALVAALAASTAFAAYYSWMVGIQLALALLGWPLVALLLRYAAELVVHLVALPVAPSVVLHRGWVRGAAIVLGIMVSGLPVIVFLMSRFPFELPYPGDQLFRLPPYVGGIEPMVEHVVGAAALTLIVVVKGAFELHSVWGRTRQSVRHLAWVDRLLNARQAPVASEAFLGPDAGDV